LPLDCPVSIFSFPAGEKQKSLSTILELFTSLVQANFDRKSLIIAFGGGVVGDMGGFLASIFLRGVPFIQVPTSLLAMVDSSIGGKTGVDTTDGKNLMGSFYQPRTVIIDMDFLSTLPRIEFLNGMAEIIKHALIQDPLYFEFIKDNREKILALDSETILQLVEMSCMIKTSIVEKDEKENGLRQTLNFGHTTAHAIENASNYSVPHGFAVALGMIIEAHISFRRKLLSENELKEIVELISLYELTQYKNQLKKLSPQSLIDSAKKDKKNIKEAIKSVLLEKIGKTYSQGNSFSWQVQEEEIEAGLVYLLNAL
jgi:3-dehydroquinate synthase